MAKVLHFRRCRGRDRHHDKTGRYCFGRLDIGGWWIKDHVKGIRIYCSTRKLVRSWIKAAEAFKP